MTIVRAQNLSKEQRQQHHLSGGGYAGCGGGFTENFALMSRVQGYEYCSTTDQSCLGSDLVLVGDRMAEDESRTNSLNEAGSSSKDIQEERPDEGWLQLSIGGGHSSTATHNNVNKHDDLADPRPDQELPD
ncbi:hypothetical protein SLA2020_365140 [Shorea laevis]